MRIEDQHDELYAKEIEPVKNQDRFITDSICFDAVRLSKRTNAKAIVTMTNSGYTAFKISSQRPEARIFVYSGNKKLLTTLSLVWGVKTFFYDKMVSTDHTIDDIKLWIKTITENDFNQLFTLSTEISVKNKKVKAVKTTLARELIFAGSHAVHHYAMITQISFAQKKHVDSSFGIAPATITFIKQNHSLSA